MANPKSVEARQAFIDKNPFEGLKISDNSILSKLNGRHPCPKCHKSRKFFCYTCYVPITELEGKLPTLKLPIKIDIIKHKHEIDGKSTAGHAAVLASDDVTIYTYPDIPDYDEKGVVLIFPSYNALSVSQIFSKNSIKNEVEMLPKGYNQSTLMKKLLSTANSDLLVEKTNKLPINKAIFIDSTWNQSKGIYKDERIKKLKCVVLQNRISQFWRHQKGSPRWYLATIEAIHQFLIEIHINAWGFNPSYKGLKNCFSEKYISQFEELNVNGNSYNGQYDDLLFFFQHMYDLIHKYYQHEDLQAYKRQLM